MWVSSRDTSLRIDLFHIDTGTPDGLLMRLKFYSANIINLSLSEGSFPLHFKSANISPSFEKTLPQ